MTERARLADSEECFTVADLNALTDLVAATWLAAAHSDWSVPAGILEWSCISTADHAVDCVYAPAFFLASRRLDRYPVAGSDLTLGARATPELLVDSLWLASRMLAAVVNHAEPDVRAIIFQRPEALTGAPRDFVPRAALPETNRDALMEVGMGRSRSNRRSLGRSPQGLGAPISQFVNESISVDRYTLFCMQDHPCVLVGYRAIGATWIRAVSSGGVPSSGQLGPVNSAPITSPPVKG